jgi:hypothetical protein
VLASSADLTQYLVEHDRIILSDEDVFMPSRKSDRVAVVPVNNQRKILSLAKQRQAREAASGTYDLCLLSQTMPVAFCRHTDEPGRPSENKIV